MTFTEYQYSVHEDEDQLEVCVELFMYEEGTLKTGVWIRLFTVDNTAIGEYLKGAKFGNCTRHFFI